MINTRDIGVFDDHGRTSHAGCNLTHGTHCIAPRVVNDGIFHRRQCLAFSNRCNPNFGGAGVDKAFISETIFFFKFFYYY